MSFGFGVNDFIQVSQLAFKLYRKCRESPRDFANLTSEVANLQVVIDDVRLTIREEQLDQERTEEILHLGQSCYDCLLELEALLRRYHSLGTRSKRTFDRIGFERDRVNEIRQRVIANTGLLNAFTSSLTRSSVVRLEATLNRFIEEYITGRREGSVASKATTVISKVTIDSIQKEDDDVWQEIINELQEDGITAEQIFENKQLIKERILVQSVRDIYRDAPENLSMIKAASSHLWDSTVDVNYEVQDANSLSYHENLSRKKRMEPIIKQINQTLDQLTRLESSFKFETSEGDTPYIWVCKDEDVQKASSLSKELDHGTGDLQVIFRDFGTIVLCNIEDRMKIIVREVKARERSKSILSSWDELEASLVDGLDVTTEDTQRHQEAIQSFLRLLTDDEEVRDVEAQARVDTSSITESSRSRVQFPPFNPPPTPPKDNGRLIDPAKSKSSLSSSDALSLSRPVPASKVKPKRTSVLFVDLSNTERSPMAQAYLEHLMREHVTLAACFSRVLSAGLSASKPGVPLPAGVEFLLRDYGISEDFQHTSRRLEKRDVERFEYILAMNQAQIDEILSRYPVRAETAQNGEISQGPFREDLAEHVVLLGSFGGHGPREVTHPESINGSRFFHIGSKRIYPGYDKSLQEIKVYIADFIHDLTGFDLHSLETEGHEEQDSRDTSRYVSEDEDYSSVFQDQVRWSFEDERPGFDELVRAVSKFEESTESSSPAHHGDPFPSPDTPITVRIKPEPQATDSDEEFLHKYHEQFDELVRLLLTDVGDSSLSSLRQNVLDWEGDNTRNLLSVNTGGVQWVLEKINSDSNDGCQLCLENRSRSGYVRDNQLNYITTEEADLLCKYLNIAIQHSRNQPGVTEDEARSLEHIRDHPLPRPNAPPSIKDDVSVSVRDDKRSLTHDVALIRQRDAQNGPTQRSNTQASVDSPGFSPRRQPLIRRVTEGDDTVGDLRKESSPEPKREHKVSNASESTIRAALATNPAPKTKPLKDKRAVTKEGASPSRGKTPLPPVKKVSILFLSTAQLHGCLIAEVYLASLVSRSLALANKIYDVVSAGISPLTPSDRFNPKKLHRLFKAHNLLNSWPQLPERVLLPEDVVDFDFVLLMNGAEGEALYRCWGEENEEEWREMVENARGDGGRGGDWRSNFKTKVLDLGAFRPGSRPPRPQIAADQQGKNPKEGPLMDPVQPDQQSTATAAFGVRQARFEEHFDEVKEAVDGFLSVELGFEVERMAFERGRSGVGPVG
ncbi:MAG: hypothetical protein Q9160_004289 [Pyrenula sp. 1 TL-2023]